MTVIISTANAIEICDLMADKLDGGKFEIYDGARPANPGTAVTTQTKLAEGTFAGTAFGNAAMVGNVAVAAAAAIADITGLAAGTATWVRVKDSGGNAEFDGSVTNNAGSGDMKISNTTFAIGSTAIVISLNVRVPTGQ